MAKNIIYRNLGLIDYKEAWDFQEKILQKIILQKTNGKNNDDFLFLCEHPNVYTIGKSGSENNLLVNDTFLKSINATYYKINRGGDITYHGPGQIVGYPVINLENFNLGVKAYVGNIEQVIINFLERYKIKSGRLNGATGVWLDVGTKNERKICAIGVRVSRGVTMHGFAFNINTDLKYFDYINPCGFTDKGVTSLSKELNRTFDMSEIKNELKDEFFKVFCN
ncbi:MAG: lipoate--protein ligase [Bacteroidetes bacterium]|nr:MAG: lipoate--protein ligase [Bacteroidota bacterium]